MVFDVARLAVWSSEYNRDSVPDNATRSYPTNVGPSSYCGRWYDYVSGLANQFNDVVHAAEQPLGNGCTQSQLKIVAELVNIKLHVILEGDFDYCMFCGEARYKSTRTRNPNRKNTVYTSLSIQSPLGMCMSAEVIMVILDPSNPKHLINVYLEPLIEDLQNLRHVGVLTCDTEKRVIHNARHVDVDCERPTRL
ncbi:UNVERIFIED_CONTAM: hypothetical protein Sindi_2947900 [Sesamum indicum]